MTTVAIVGRPNVGKSTLFNRLIESRKAIVDDVSGITRDRLYGSVFWNGVTFSVIDTGGYVPGSDRPLESAIRDQVELAVEEADAILFVVDIVTGITDLDETMAAMLRPIGKPVLVVANKADNMERRWAAAEFYRLGIDPVFPVSAINGSGTGELLDTLVAELPKEEEEEDQENRPRIAFIGRPNVGKSSLTNALIGTERSIVTEIAGTTRDRIDSVLRFKGRELTLIDTAGLRRKTRITGNVEFYASVRTQRAIAECDVAVLLIDAEQGLEAQDIRVLKQAEEQRKGLVLAVNKWDLIPKETNTARAYERTIRERIPTMNYVPILFISALTRQRIFRLMERVVEVVDARGRRLPTSELNDVMHAAVRSYPPAMDRGRQVKIRYFAQVHVNPPVIGIFTNRPKGIRDDYRRYLENKLRAAFAFEGVPVVMSFRKS